MAAPTNVRVEAISITSTVLRWEGGVGDIGVYRSTDGSAYTLIPSVESPIYTVAAGTLIYTDVGLVVGTKYWYKLTDDGGSTFSAVVTVWTHFCASQADGPDTLALPRMYPGGDDLDAAAAFNELAQTVEVTLGDRILRPTSCEICSVDGALVIDCSAGCHEFVVDVTEDINSISMNFCEGGATVDFVIPPNTTRRICGWPAGMGFTGDECTQAPLTGGAGGSTQGAYVDKLRIDPKSRTGYGGGGGGGGADCTCVPGPKNELTIKSCNPNNRLCVGPVPRLMLKVCGGKPPYTWTKTGGVKFQGDIANRSTDKDTVTNDVQNRTPSVVVLPPVNNGAAVVGEAYRSVSVGCASLSTAVFLYASFKCNDTAFNSPNCTEADFSTPMSCVNGDLPPSCSYGVVCNGDGSGGTCTCSGKHTTGVSPCSRCSNVLPPGALCDKRTVPMISAGCNPCGLQNGSTVSVTDSIGTVATIILRN